MAMILIFPVSLPSSWWWQGVGWEERVELVPIFRQETKVQENGLPQQTENAEGSQRLLCRHLEPPPDLGQGRHGSKESGWRCRHMTS